MLLKLRTQAGRALEYAPPQNLCVPSTYILGCFDLPVKEYERQPHQFCKAPETSNPRKTAWQPCCLQAPKSPCSMSDNPSWTALCNSPKPHPALLQRPHCTIWNRFPSVLKEAHVPTRLRGSLSATERTCTNSPRCPFEPPEILQKTMQLTVDISPNKRVFGSLNL